MIAALVFGAIACFGYFALLRHWISSSVLVDENDRPVVIPFPRSGEVISFRSNRLRAQGSKLRLQADNTPSRGD